MKLADFNYSLPKELIAHTPAVPRDNSRLLIVWENSSSFIEKKFHNLYDILSENDVLVLNQTKVINARLIGKNEEWITCEIFLIKSLYEGVWDCLVSPWKKIKPWKRIVFSEDNDTVLIAEILEITEIWRSVRFNKNNSELYKIIDKIWNIPLPPYIDNSSIDESQYQTVYAKTQWSVAAPTAWLHFTEELLNKILSKWVKIEKVLLHVWLWTFKPVSVDNIKDHKMHEELAEIDKYTANRLNNYKSEGRRIIAVWTTSVRVLESFCDENWKLDFWKKETKIYIYPGYKWRFVESLITNFHLPKSTLLMLVSSLIWLEKTKKAYKYAIDKKFRFYSFGDAMWIQSRNK